MASTNETRLADVDAQTMALNTNLQLEDADSQSSKGEQREGEISDAAIAIQLLRQDLEELGMSHSDQRSIADAVQAGAATPSESSSSTMDAVQANAATPSESSSSAASNGSPPTITCVACTDEISISDVAQLPCDHDYCRTCLRHLFESSTLDEEMFPPRCCRQPIAVEDISEYLTDELIRNFNKKKIEYKTPNRTYCSSAECSIFIEAEHITDNVATCPSCATKTCTMCKASHEGDCPNDPALQEILKVASENKWQRCNHCRRLVELQDGCNHMMCLCGSHFCYVCGVGWKTCACSVYGNQHLAGPALQNQQAVVQAVPPLRARVTNEQIAQARRAAMEEAVQNRQAAIERAEQDRRAAVEPIDHRAMMEEAERNRRATIHRAEQNLRAAKETFEQNRRAVMGRMEHRAVMEEAERNCRDAEQNVRTARQRIDGLAMMQEAERNRQTAIEGAERNIRTAMQRINERAVMEEAQRNLTAGIEQSQNQWAAGRQFAALEQAQNQYAHINW